MVRICYFSSGPQKGQKAFADDVQASTEKFNHAKYKCLDPACKVHLIFVNECEMKGVSLKRSHFRHDHVSNNPCMFSEKNEDIDNSFYDTWIEYATNAKEIMKLENKFLVDIVDKNDIKYVVKYGLATVKNVTDIKNNNIDDVILFGNDKNLNPVANAVRINEICYINMGDNKKYFIDFKNRKTDIMNFDNATTEIYIDNGTDKLIKLLRQANGKFIDNDYIKQNYAINPDRPLYEVELIDKQEFIHARFDYEFQKGFPDQPETKYISLYTKMKILLDNIHSKKFFDSDSSSIRYDIEQCEMNGILNGELSALKDIQPGREYSDDELQNGMIAYFEAYGALPSDIDRLKTVLEVYSATHPENANNIINRYFSDIMGHRNEFLNETLIGIIISSGIVKMSDGMDHILKCWYTITYIMELLNKPGKQFVKRYVKKVNIEKNLYDICYIVPSFADVDKALISKGRTTITSKQRISCGIKKMNATDNIYYVGKSEIKARISKYFNAHNSPPNILDDSQILDIIKQQYVTKKIFNLETYTSDHICVSNDLYEYEKYIKSYLLDNGKFDIKNDLDYIIDTETKIKNLLNIAKGTKIFTDYNLDLTAPTNDEYYAQQASGMSNQKNAVITSVSNKYSLIAGIPGSGKSTIIKHIVTYFLKNNKNCYLMAPTGTASEVLKRKLRENMESMEKLCESMNVKTDLEKHEYNTKECKQLQSYITGTTKLQGKTLDSLASKCFQQYAPGNNKLADKIKYVNKLLALHLLIIEQQEFKKVSDISMADNIMTIDKFIAKFPYRSYNRKSGSKKETRCDVIIIDEMSMVDLKKFYKLLNMLKTSEESPHIIMVGDPDQLPSIKTGQLLYDLLNMSSYGTHKYNLKQPDNEHIENNAINILYPKQSMGNTDHKRHNIFLESKIEYLDSDDSKYERVEECDIYAFSDGPGDPGVDAPNISNIHNKIKISNAIPTTQLKYDFRTDNEDIKRAIEYVKTGKATELIKAYKQKITNDIFTNDIKVIYDSDMEIIDDLIKKIKGTDTLFKTLILTPMRNDKNYGSIALNNRINELLFAKQVLYKGYKIICTTAWTYVNKLTKVRINVDDVFIVKHRLKDHVYRITRYGTTIDYLVTKNDIGKFKHKIKRLNVNSRIMCTKNGDYSGIHINNGDMFKLLSIEKHGTKKEYTLGCINNNDQIKLTANDIQKFETAWAVTIHKSQGSEIENVIMMFPCPFGRTINLYTKNILYTGVTRCRSKCIILCQNDQVFIDMAAREKSMLTTTLQIANID